MILINKRGRTNYLKRKGKKTIKMNSNNLEKKRKRLCKKLHKNKISIWNASTRS